MTVITHTQRKSRLAEMLDRPGGVSVGVALAQARAQAALNVQAHVGHRSGAAANDGQWRLRALGSLAVLGLVGLLALQFDRGTPEEREAAFGTAPRAPGRCPWAAWARRGMWRMPAPSLPAMPPPT